VTIIVQRQLLFALLLSLSGVSAGQAESDMTVVGAGNTGVIAYEETVTGKIEASDMVAMPPIDFVGHNGQDRRQGDFDVWYFDAGEGDHLIITMTATGGDLIPTVLLVNDDGASIPGVAALDTNPDGDLSAGVCLTPYVDNRFAIVVFRQEDTRQTGTYTLTLNSVTSVEALSDYSTTAICRVGTFVFTRGNTAIPVYAGPDTKSTVIGHMLPNSPYSYFPHYGDSWTIVVLRSSDGRFSSGYVSSDLVRISGQMQPDPYHWRHH
jgi:hypothetical protein